MNSSLARRLCGVLACMGAAIAFTPGAATAVVAHPQAGRLPGFPRVRGVVPVLNSPAARSTHESLVHEAFSGARAERRSLEPNPARLPCPEEFAFTQNVCYLGGPVLRNPVVHLIFWLGPNVAGTPTTPRVRGFPAAYRVTIERYFADLAHDRGVATDVSAVDPQYSDASGPGVNGSTFDAASDSVLDGGPFPPVHSAEECSDPSEFSEGPCLLDSDVRQEITRVAIEKGWSTGLGNIFFVFTAPGVGSCASVGCSYTAYCAYHSDFGGNGVTPGPQTIYANMPYAAPGACDSGIHPNEAGDEGTDAAIDTASHELNETITDPLGSQCKSKTECEPSSWTDAIGQEIADKCLPPETTLAGTYGEPLVEGLGASSYNQLVNGHHYWTQTEWSNEAGKAEGRCVQRFVNAAFNASSGAQATVPASFDGSPSGEGAADPIVYWAWNFGDKIQVGTSEATVSHTYATPGVREVTLTAYDRYGNSNTHTLAIEVGAAPPAPVAVVTVTATKTLTEAGPPRPNPSFTANEIAKKLALPGNRVKLGGQSTIALGRAECPPACHVTLKLYALVRTGVKGHRTTLKQVLIGTLVTTIAPKGTGALVVVLNAAGRKLLGKGHRLSSRLIVTVVGQEGGTWQIFRSLTLTR